MPIEEAFLDRENDLFQVLLALKENRRKRKELGEVFVEGVAAIKSALANGFVVERALYEDFASLSDWAKGVVEGQAGAQKIRVSASLMSRLSERSEGSELLVTLRMDEPSLDSLALPPRPFIVILDRPSNHGNLGSIIRSCDAFGVDLVVTTGHAVDLYDPAVIRSSLGALFSTPVLHEESTRAVEGWLASLKRADPSFKVFGTDSDSRTSIEEETSGRPAALILGNEAKGLSVRLKSFVDTMLRIPMVGSVDSLNVACAASICIYKIFANSRGGPSAAKLSTPSSQERIGP